MWAVADAVILTLISIAFLAPLVLTIFVEALVAWVVGLEGPGSTKTVVLVNVLTNPVAVWLLMYVATQASTMPQYWTIVGSVEAGVALVEWRLLRWVLALRSRRAALVSLSMNAASFALGVALMGANPVSLQYLPTPADRAATITSLERQVRTAFGDDLESVEITYGRYEAEPTFFGVFRLKGVPLEFRFQPGWDELNNYGLSTAALVDNEIIGGETRFVQLARRFHADFPDEHTMFYWPIELPQVQDFWPGSLTKPLEGREGPNIVIYDRNRYWGGFAAKSLGVYSWDPAAQEWDLLYRGEVPDY